MRANRLQSIRGIYPSEVPPKGSESWGRTDAGQTIYRRKVKRRTKVPVLHEDGEKKGKQVHRGGNPMTGEPGTPVFRYVEGEEEWEYFTITRGKHGNNRIVVYDRAQAKKEKANKLARDRKETLLEKVATRAAEIGMDLDEAVDKILGLGPAVEPALESEGDSPMSDEEVAVALAGPGEADGEEDDES